jgi:glycosyltransferase involved in cell wall biosynthesis
LYRSATVFVLPTLSDAFAMTQLEAQAHGLPIIVTPSCGRVVIEGETGFMVAARDAQALAVAIRRFIQDRGLSARMAPRCIERAKEFNVDAYGNQLLSIISNRMRHRAASHKSQPVSQATSVPFSSSSPI